METYTQENPLKLKSRVALWGGLLLLLALSPHIMPNNYWLRIQTMAGLYVMLALGLNVVAGFAGLLDLAYVAFFGIGAYIFAFLSSEQFGIHLPFLLVLPICAFATMGFGFALGSTSMRLKGDYLAIVTLAFSQIFKLLLLNLDRPINITGGVNGIFNFDPIRILGFQLVSPLAYSYLIWLSAILVLLGCYRIKNSRYGRGWEAIREDELAAEAMGVNTSWMKLKAFAGGAFIAGASGALFASFQDSVFPNNFDFPQLVIIYCMVILGGLGNIIGVVLGAVLLAILPEFLRQYGAYRMMSFGLILIVLMALRPQGILGSIGFLVRGMKRPDKDESGVLRASTDLYYRSREHPVERGEECYTKGERVLLELRNVTQDFGGLRAVNDLSFKLHEREILSIIGPNGAGKSTVFNIISGIYPPTTGMVMFEGKDITGLKPHQIVKTGIARTFQNLRLFGNMSVLDNAKVGQFCRTRSGPLSILLHLPRFRREEEETEKKVKEILELFGARLTGYRFDQQALYLSYANRRRLEIARALATNAKVLMLDEPSAGMNPQETEEITLFIKKLRDTYGYTILLIEHKLNVVQAISDTVIALDYGRKIAEGTYDEVANNEQVIEAYLGRKRG
ncbi:MAG: branched-chain amino acid ABC transporter ATP-binding protein/permease [Deltaproteobacteria bacterium]|nr:branched-chain amino acid ABC transporter ATP-binding protein/permease [Deltaproteobacteria bacterium]MBW2015487.1 branched-chain amino acid ABC transporter ATP-binding protein/permease [Deltaproteobacteria bacterium]MBW2128765.1 branched-chain amino acid ABC transporter ATP-binding protein/permease [Deltaproteobacteria bacterium]MBW2303907.1 branched-chain amino acid ABC transporter ATP-binding protein/permease [Deltaproteobacteria bacterium]